jgi:hypothetical protein
MKLQAVKQYVREIDKTHATGKTTEHSFRPALRKLVESFGEGIAATNAPKRVACGAPGRAKRGLPGSPDPIRRMSLSGFSNGSPASWNCLTTAKTARRTRDPRGNCGKRGKWQKKDTPVKH